ncbi:hypothetical protein [Prosthecomicrobium sp. N25]|uniref:hypothetical protein n=1 Tax=Prosthecomicrobium sp. N25 TaxID=3129254 RepID=UPI003076B16C
MSVPSISARLVLAAALALAAPLPAAAEFLFVSPSADKQNRVYWVDRFTGSVGACQYQTSGGPNGSMLCFPPGEGAQAMPSGDYDLKASTWKDEWGVFRLNRLTGEMSLCFVREDKVVCTPQAIAR